MNPLRFQSQRARLSAEPRLRESSKLADLVVTGKNQPLSLQGWRAAVGGVCYCWIETEIIRSVWEANAREVPSPAIG